MSRRPGLEHTRGMFRGNRFCRNIFCTSRTDAVTYFIHGWHEAVLERCDENLFYQPAAPDYRVEWQEHPQGLTSSSFAAWQEMGFDRNSVLADPLFVDAAALDLRLRPDSPALRLGFVPIPLDRIGVRPRREPHPAPSPRSSGGKP